MIDLYVFATPNCQKISIARRPERHATGQPALQAWLDTVSTRPAVLRGMAVPIV